MRLSEKYRPVFWNDFVGEEIKNKLKNFYKNPQHLLLAGDVGLGKSTAAYIIAREMINSNPLSSMDFLELNSSNDRGIDVVRGKIKDFARTSSLSGHKIILLDEVDSMTGEAQHALRREMEIYNKTIFILTANYPHKIIKPLKDRCMVINFTTLKPEEIQPKLKVICEKEEFNFDDESLLIIAKKSGGSMRKAIEELQFYSPNIMNISPADDKIKRFIDILTSSEYLKSRYGRKYDMYVSRFGEGVLRQKELMKMYKSLELKDDFLPQLFEAVKSPQIPSSLKLPLFILISKYDYYIAVGSTPEIQVAGLFAEMVNEVGNAT